MARSYVNLASLQKSKEPEPKVTYTQHSSGNKNNSDSHLDTKHINPYNFVPFGTSCIRSPYIKGDISGKIHCTLVPKSDFFIPNTSNVSCEWSGRTNKERDKNGEYLHKAREFFSYKNLDEKYDISQNPPPSDPIIPGSELRGMIRNMYEAITDSCLSAFDENKELSSRTAVPNSPGMLKYTETGWKLFKADLCKVEYKNKRAVSFRKTNGAIIGTDGKEYPSFSKVNFNFETVESKNKQNKVITTKYVTEFGSKGRNTGYLLVGEDFPKKHLENIFMSTGSLVYSDSDKLIESVAAYNKILSYYNNSKINKAAKKQSFYKNSEININNYDREYPVWYKKVEGKIYLSPACIGRYIYQNKLTDFVRNYQPCSSKDCVCEACSMFGFINDGILPSSVRFSDAVFTGIKPEYQKITTLRELSGPKITSMDMYTHLENEEVGSFWTYDFFIKGQEYIALGKNDLLLNGRKFYYHSQENYEAKPDKNGVIQTERNSTVRPMKGCSNNKFEFDVYFEHISEDQLKKLLVVLSLRGNDSEYAYKLGTGKPIGMGSVKIKVDDVFVRQINKETFEYKLVSVNEKFKDYFMSDKLFDCFNLSEKSKITGSLEQLTSLNYAKNLGIKVSYPFGKDKDNNPGEGYQWFMNNRGKVNTPQFDQLLFNAQDGLFDNIAKKAESSKNNKNNNYYNRRK